VNGKKGEWGIKKQSVAKSGNSLDLAGSKGSDHFSKTG
jgi:hypothetical protein